MRRLPSLAALRAFEAAARRLSFKEAAAELGVTPTAISHQMRLLEATIGVRLFERRTRQVLLTPEGQRLYPVLRDGFDAFARALDELQSRPSRRTITLSATAAFTAKRLVPNLRTFRDAHPGLDLRLHASDEPVDFRSGNVDAAVRYGRGPYPGLVAEELVADRFAPVCSPRLEVRRPDDLLSRPLLHFEWRRVDKATPTWDAWFRRAGLAGANVAGGTTFSDEGHAIQAALAGQGVALLSLVLVADDLASGALIQPFGPILEAYRYHLLHPAGAPPADIAALRAWLRATLARA